MSSGCGNFTFVWNLVTVRISVMMSYSVGSWLVENKTSSPRENGISGWAGRNMIQVSTMQTCFLFQTPKVFFINRCALLIFFRNSWFTILEANSLVKTIMACSRRKKHQNRKLVSQLNETSVILFSVALLKGITLRTRHWWLKTCFTNNHKRATLGWNIRNNFQSVEEEFFATELGRRWMVLLLPSGIESLTGFWRQWTVWLYEELQCLSDQSLDHRELDQTV